MLKPHASVETAFNDFLKIVPPDHPVFPLLNSASLKTAMFGTDVESRGSEARKLEALGDQGDLNAMFLCLRSALASSTATGLLQSQTPEPDAAAHLGFAKQLFLLAESGRAARNDPAAMMQGRDIFLHGAMTGFMEGARWVLWAVGFSTNDKDSAKKCGCEANRHFNGAIGDLDTKEALHAARQEFWRLDFRNPCASLPLFEKAAARLRTWIDQERAPAPCP